MADPVTPPDAKLPKQKSMILLERTAAQRIWRALHQNVYIHRGNEYWQCLACAETSRRDRPSIKHERNCPVPDLYARIKGKNP